MLKYFVFDEKYTEMTISQPFDTEEEAIAFGDAQWEALSEEEKKLRRSFEVGEAYVNDRNEISWVRGYDILKSYK